MNDDILADVTLIPVSNDLVSFTATADDDRIVYALRQLSSAIAQNGKVLSSLVDRVDRIEQRLGSQNEGICGSINTFGADVLAIREDLSLSKAAYASLRETVAAHKTVLEMDSRLTESVEEVRDRIRAIEKGECSSLKANISAISGKIAVAHADASEERMRGLLNVSTANVINTCDERFKGCIADLERQTATVLSQQRSQLELMVGERVGENREVMEEGIAHISHFLVETMRLFFSVQDKTQSAAHTSLSHLRRRLIEVSDAINVLFSTLMLDPTGCYSLCGVVKGAPAGEQAWAGSMEQELNSLVVEARSTKGSTGLENLDVLQNTLFPSCLRRSAAFGNEIMRLVSPITSDEGLGPVASLLPVDAGGRERRVSFLSQLPQSAAMHSTFQREIENRGDLLRSELQHDMVTELLDLQRELKGKVTTAKLSEIMELHRDEQLYTTVKSVVADLQDIRASKLDVQQFVDALRAKADTRMLESKVESGDLNNQIDIINNSAERFSRELTKAAERSRQIEGNLQNLQQYVMSGGGVYGMVAELNSKLSESSGILEHLTEPECPSGFQASDAGGSGGLRRGLQLKHLGVDSSGARPTATKSLEMLETLNWGKDASGLIPRDAAEGRPAGDGLVVGPGDGLPEASGRDAPEWRGGGGGFRVVPPRSARRPETGGSRGVSEGRSPVFDRIRPQTGGTLKDSFQRAAINHHLPGGTLNAGPTADPAGPPSLPLVRGPTSVPMTSSQRAYCEQLEIDPAEGLRVLQAATPSITTREARGLRPM